MKNKLILEGRIEDENGNILVNQELEFLGYSGFPLQIKEIGHSFILGLETSASGFWTKEQEVPKKV